MAKAADDTVVPFQGQNTVDDQTDGLNLAQLEAGYIRAIADLVANSDHGALFDQTLSTAMCAIINHTERLDELTEGVFSRLDMRARAIPPSARARS